MTTVTTTDDNDQNPALLRGRLMFALDAHRQPRTDMGHRSRCPSEDVP